MAELEVYVECDHRQCRARSREYWIGNAGLPLYFCGHHGDALAIRLHAQGFRPMDDDRSTDDCDTEVIPA